MTLAEVQAALRAPKNKTNQFGHFNYRTAEGILAAFHALKSGAKLTLSDSVVEVGGILFLEATATFTTTEETDTAFAYAQLDNNHAGMCAEQRTGAASSYARKYALCGLLAIDDSSVDPDSMRPEETKQTPAPAPAPKKETKLELTPKQKRVIKEGRNDDFLNAIKYIEDGHTVEELKKWFDLELNAEKSLRELKDKLLTGRE